MEIWALNVLEISRDNLNSYKILVISMYYLMDLKFYRYIFLISWKTKNKYKSIPTLQLYVCTIWWVHCWLQRKTEEASFFFFFFFEKNEVQEFEGMTHECWKWLSYQI